MELSEWREELAGVIGRARDGSDHSPMCSDEEPCRYCTPIADALLASPAVARLLAETWDRGAAKAWGESGEGWNGEYPDHAVPRWADSNPYRTNAHPTDDHAGEAETTETTDERDDDE